MSEITTKTVKFPTCMEEKQIPPYQPSQYSPLAINVSIAPVTALQYTNKLAYGEVMSWGLLGAQPC